MSVAAQQQRIRYGDMLISFRVRAQPARQVQRIAIHVEPDGRVVVDAPQGATPVAVRAAVARRARWISGHVAAARSRFALVRPREHVSGESLLYLGRRYVLKVVIDAALHGSVRMRAGRIEVAVARRDPAQVRALLDAWYLVRAREVIAARLAALASSLRWVRAVPPLHFRAMKRQWGSCSPAGRLTLNPHLVKAPRECIDYVLLHEMCHLRHAHHGPAFHRALDARMPEWRTVKERLDALVEQITAR